MKKLILLLMLIPVVGWGQIVGLWRLSGDVTDGTGNGYNGTATSLTYVGGINGQCGSFSGSSRVQIPTMGTFTGTGTYTLFAWIKPTAVNVAYQRILTIRSTASSTAEFGIELVLNTNKITAFASNVTTTFDPAIDPGTASAGIWYYIVGTFDGTNVKLYINGVWKATTAYSAGTKIVSNSQLWDIGTFKQAATYYGLFNGLIDNAGVGLSAWTGAYIKNQYAFYKGFYQ